MSIQSYIDSIREKPEHIRKRHAFWYSFGVTAIIFAFWVGSITGFGGHKSAAVASASDSISSPGQSMVAGIGSLGKDIWELIFSPKKVTYSTVEISAGK